MCPLIYLLKYVLPFMLVFKRLVHRLHRRMTDQTCQSATSLESHAVGPPVVLGSNSGDSSAACKLCGSYTW